MTRHKKEEFRFIDVDVSEIAIPPDPDSIPDRHVDRGVVPWAMVEYLKWAEEFPVAPTLSWSEPLFRIVEGGRCLWAAKQSGWTQPIHSVLVANRASVPDAVWRRTKTFTVPDEENSEPAFRTQVLCFCRPLSEGEKEAVEQELLRLAETAQRRNLKTFSKVKDFAWPAANVLRWSTIAPSNTEDRSGAIELFEAMTKLRGMEVPLAAFNGRRCYY